MTLFVGTSGWHYAHWKGGFYPAGVPASRWLETYAERFATVEVNNAFYRLPDPATFERWADTLPDDFIVSVKVSRYLTHVRRLREPKEPVDRLLERASGLGAKLGPLLLQLPPNLTVDLEALDATLGCFPRSARVAVEPRHDSWFAAETEALLADHNAALCLADRSGMITPLWRTADWGYVRFHHGSAQPPSGYGHGAMRAWAERLRDLWPGHADVYAYFNNDLHGCAPRDAHRLALAAARAGLQPTRTPPPRTTPTRL